MNKGWLHVVFDVHSWRSNVVDLTEVLWKDFRKFLVKRKPPEISSLRFWELNQAIATEPKEAFISFKATKAY